MCCRCCGERVSQIVWVPNRAAADVSTSALEDELEVDGGICGFQDHGPFLVLGKGKKEGDDNRWRITNPGKKSGRQSSKHRWVLLAMVGAHIDDSFFANIENTTAGSVSCANPNCFSAYQYTA